MYIYIQKENAINHYELSGGPHCLRSKRDGVQEKPDDNKS